MTTPTDVSVTGFSFDFGDRTLSLRRQVTGYYKAPFVMTYQGDFEQKSPKDRPMVFNLTAFMTPTKPGWSRLILLGANRNPDAETRKTERVYTKIVRRIPPWLLHTFSHKFLDSDLYFLHFQEQERIRRDPEDSNQLLPYFMPSKSDRCIGAFRRWVGKYARFQLPLPPPIPDRSVLFDRWNQHGKNCIHCTNARKNVEKWKKRTRMTLYASILLSKFPIARAVVVFCLIATNRLTAFEKAQAEGGFDHFDNH